MSEQLLEKLAEIGRKLKSQEPLAVTANEKQAAYAIAILERTVIELLIEEHMPPKLIVLSLFYFWIILEASLYGVTEKQLNNLAIPLVSIIKATVAKLPVSSHGLDQDRNLGKGIACCGKAKALGVYTALYLASDESKYVMGSELHIDGGLLAGSTASPKAKQESK